MGQYCFDREVQQGKKIAHAAVKVEAVERYVVLCARGCEEVEQGKVYVGL